MCAVVLCDYHASTGQLSPMGDTDKSPSLTRLLGVSTPLLLPSFCLSTRPMTLSSKLPHGEDDDMLMLVRLLRLPALDVDVAAAAAAAAATAVVVAGGHTDDRNALPPWVFSIAISTRRAPW